MLVSLSIYRCDPRNNSAAAETGAAAAAAADMLLRRWRRCSHERMKWVWMSCEGWRGERREQSAKCGGWIVPVQCMYTHTHILVCMLICAYMCSLVCQYVHTYVIWFSLFCCCCCFPSFMFVCVCVRHTSCVVVVLVTVGVHEYKCCLSVDVVVDAVSGVRRPHLSVSFSSFVCVSFCVLPFVWLLLLCMNMCLFIVVCTCCCCYCCLAGYSLTHSFTSLAWTFCFGFGCLLINAVRLVILLYLYVHKQIYKSHRHAYVYRPHPRRPITSDNTLASRIVRVNIYNTYYLHIRQCVQPNEEWLG